MFIEVSIGALGRDAKTIVVYIQSGSVKNNFCMISLHVNSIKNTWITLKTKVIEKCIYLKQFTGK